MCRGKRKGINQNFLGCLGLVGDFLTKSNVVRISTHPWEDIELVFPVSLSCETANFDGMIASRKKSIQFQARSPSIIRRG